MPSRATYLGKSKARRAKLADAEHKVLGVRGKPLFSDLSYFKCVLLLFQALHASGAANTCLPVLL